MRCTGVNRSDVAPAECGAESRSEGGSFGGPIRRRSRTLRVFCVHSASRSSGSFRTPSSVFRALIELFHSLFEITRFRRGKARTLLFGSLPGTVGQRLENRLQRRGAGRITPVTKNLQENPDILSLMWINGKQAVAAGARVSRRTRAGRRRMRDPGRKRLRDRFFIGKAALRPFALKLPVQVGRQANGGFNCISGTHKVRLPKLRHLPPPSTRRRARDRRPSSGATKIFVPPSPFQYQNRSVFDLSAFYQRAAQDARVLF